MMASYTLMDVFDVFPVGTLVGAYDAGNWRTAGLPPSGTPQGSATATATVDSGGELAFTGLAANRGYYAAAQVGGAWRYQGFTAPDDTTPTGLDARMDVAEASLADVTGTRLPAVESRSGILTKRVTLPLSTGQDGVVAAGYSSLTARALLTLPMSTSRWRLRLSNAPIVGSGPAESSQVTGLWMGTPAYTSPVWDGTLAADPSLVIAGFAVPSDGSEVVTSWVTGGSAQFSKGVTHALSLGWYAPAGNSTLGWVYSHTGGVVARGLGGIAGPSVGAGLAAMPSAVTVDVGTIFPFRISIEYEITALSAFGVATSVPVLMGIGDSITSGYVDNGAACYPHESWLGAAGLRNECAWVNLGVGGRQSTDFVTGPTTNPYFTRADLVTTPPDVAIINIGSNDATVLVSAATFQANVRAIIANCRLINPAMRVFLATVIPRGFSPPVYEVDSVAVTGAPSGGTFTLTFTILGQTVTTAVISPTATAAVVEIAVQNALNAVLPGRTVLASGGPLGTAPVSLTFRGAAYGPVTGRSVAHTFTGGSSPAATFTQTTLGVVGSEAVRQAYNTWMRSLPAGVAGCFDFDKQLALQTAPSQADTDLMSTSNIHPSKGGYQRMAQAISIRKAA